MAERQALRNESLKFVQSLLGQLRQMAEAERCDMLSYLIEMAYVEASDILRGNRPSRIHEQKRDPATGMAFQTARKVKLQQ